MDDGCLQNMWSISFNKYNIFNPRNVVQNKKSKTIYVLVVYKWFLVGYNIISNSITFQKSFTSAVILKFYPRPLNSIKYTYIIIRFFNGGEP